MKRSGKFYRWNGNSRRIAFIWEHEIKDKWFQIEDYLEGGDAQ